MADPVTMAVVGGSVGAMMNKKDPLKGALLGAAGGYGGATMLGGSAMLGGAGSTASGILPSAASGSTVVNPVMAGQAFTAGPSAAMNAANLTTGPAGTLGVEASKAGLFGGGIGNSQAGVVPSLVRQPFVSGPSSVEASMFADKPTIFQQLGSYAQENPVLTQMGMQSAQSLLNQQQQQPAPAGIMRGSPSQVQMPQYQFGPPKISLI